MAGRIYGLETEYGCLMRLEDRLSDPDTISSRVKDWVFQESSLGIVDIHYRDRGEPPGNGGFLFNSGRIYIDMGHLEYTTPECSSVFDLVAFDKAGDRILLKALEGLGLRETVSFFKNNIDHHTGATFGCHENYLLSRKVSFGRVAIPTLLPFFVTRQIFAGAGRVGQYDDLFGYYDLEDDQEPVVFQISQRADHIVTEVYQWIQFSRAIINTRDEPLADPTRFRRLHLLVGDSNMSEYAAALKIGTTSLVLDLIERGIIPRRTHLMDPVRAIREISRDTSFRWIVELYDGRTISAVDLQRKYLRLAQKYLSGRNEESDWILRAWESVLDDLERDPMLLADRVDWVAKKWLLETFIASEGLSWDDPWIQSLDLEYHNLDEKKGLYYELEQRGAIRRAITEAQIDRAVRSPPQTTRAKARAVVVRALAETGIPYIINWDSIYVENGASLRMDDPLRTYEREASDFIERLGGLSLVWSKVLKNRRWRGTRMGTGEEGVDWT